MPPRLRATDTGRVLSSLLADYRANVDVGFIVFQEIILCKNLSSDQTIFDHLELEWKWLNCCRRAGFRGRCDYAVIKIRLITVSRYG